MYNSISSNKATRHKDGIPYLDIQTPNGIISLHFGQYIIELENYDYKIMDKEEFEEIYIRLDVDIDRIEIGNINYQEKIESVNLKIKKIKELIEFVKTDKSANIAIYKYLTLEKEYDCKYPEHELQSKLNNCFDERKSWEDKIKV